MKVHGQNEFLSPLDFSKGYLAKFKYRLIYQITKVVFYVV